MSPATEAYHIPALRTESIDALNVRPDGTYADATFGGGGHTRALLERLGPDGRVFGFDRDLDALANAPDDSRFTFVHSDFRFMPNFLRYYGVERLDGIIADLGVSFHHFDAAERGFSFRADAPLDMRMNTAGGRTAADLLASATEEDLAALLRTYGEVRGAGAAARAIAAARRRAPILTTAQLAEAVAPTLNPRSEKKDLARIFQALRIEVNDELGSLRALLTSAPRMLREGGRLAILTYHSLEDRMVKNTFRTGNPDGRLPQTDIYGRPATPWRDVLRGAVAPTEAEVESNPRARSAKLRAAELITPLPSYTR